MKLKDYKQAEKLCTKVLELESTNVKALYRRAQAYIQLADLDLAEIDIKKVSEIDPNNSAQLISLQGPNHVEHFPVGCPRFLRDPDSVGRLVPSGEIA
ncbi:hypothetical protein IFM89_024949 [Coptis chinensis]|uniref:Uncharacterized protein n=1 Tax=Coptis chinensis TaxID=261450 RepID=A0A835M718_9MAGN|nr:hypothetical protein IFM89_024949 [Coptis chinensis]